jgi:catechol 2,3-dioxygenase-like lactoylglutathione lyase family enzyme
VSVITDIAYVRYQAPDLGRMEAFLQDFGLQRQARLPDALYMRGRGTAPFVHVTELGDTARTLGFGLQASSADDLDAIAACVGAKVEGCSEPGGGHRVRLVDPAGFLVDVVHGQTTCEPLPHRSPLGMNPATGRQRYGQPIRLKAEPSNVMRLGHVALLVPDFQAALAFYRDVLGMRASDSYWAGFPGNTIAAFMHCGLGTTWVDHHTVALITAQDGQARFDHSAFEVLDLDDVVQGGEHLRAQGHEHAWGVGRHIQGSQLFDYWRDPWGHKIEHWTDGDLVNDDTPVTHAEITDQELRQWAPPFSADFFR